MWHLAKCKYWILPVPAEIFRHDVPDLPAVLIFVVVRVVDDAGMHAQRELRQGHQLVAELDERPLNSRTAFFSAFGLNVHVDGVMVRRGQRVPPSLLDQHVASSAQQLRASRLLRE